MNRLLVICLLFLTFPVFAQYDMNKAKDTTDQKGSNLNTYELKQHIYVGADVNFLFGQNLYLYLAPMAGYELWKGVSAGVSTMYQLYRVGGSQSYHTYGGGIFARWRPPALQFILLQTEFDVYNTNDFTSAYYGDRVNVPAFMGGLGYAGGFGKSYYQIMLKYDFINNVNNPLPPLFGKKSIPLYLSYGIVFYLG